MLKKSLVIISVICLICLASTTVFASNMMKGAENAMGGMKNGTQNMAEDAGDAMAPVRDGISNMANDVKSGASKIGEDVKSAVDGSAEGRITDAGTAEYTATRTSAEADYNNKRNTTTIWTVLLIAAIAIIALVWYYGAQGANSGHKDTF